MLRLNETFTHHLWRNRYSPAPVVVGTVNLGDAFNWTTRDLSPAHRSALKEKLAGLVPDTAPVGAAELVARIAQHIQRLGDVTAPSCGVASRNDAQRSADLFFSCRDMYLAPRSLLRAVQITDALIQSEVSVGRLDRMLKSCADMVEAHGVGRATLDMVEAADRRGIPWLRPNGLARHIHLGQGFRQQSFGSTRSGAEASFACDTSRDRLQTLNVLAKIRLPVGRFSPVKNVEFARRWAEKVGYPLVLKPIDGTKGQSVCVSCATMKSCRAHLPIRAFKSDNPCCRVTSRGAITGCSSLRKRLRQQHAEFRPERLLMSWT